MNSNSTHRTRLILSAGEGIALSTRRRWQAGLAGILAVLTLGLLWHWPTPARAGDPDFAEVWFDDATDDTWSVAWGDMDGDGDLDLAVGNRTQVNRLYCNEGGALPPIRAGCGTRESFTQRGSGYM